VALYTDREQYCTFAPYYVADPLRISLPGDRVGEATTPRHRRPYMEAKYYGHTVVDVQRVN